MLKVSVIVPVYKAEQWIERCARSLFVQTLEDAEYIFVDDCSPDRSMEVLERVLADFPQRKGQVMIIRHTENRGVSVSRQDGLDAATGEYVIHADPDDWVEPEMLELLYEKAKADDADMVICDFYQVNTKTGRKRYFAQRPEALNAESVQRQLFENLHGSVWNKLVRLEAITGANVRFPEDYSFCEDLTFNAELLNQPLKITYLPEAFYNYVWSATGGSLSSAYSERIEREEKLMNQRVLSLLADRPETAEIAHLKFDTMNAARILKYASVSSVEFKHRFASLRNRINIAPVGKLTGICLRLALAGHLRTARLLFNFVQKMRDSIG